MPLDKPENERPTSADPPVISHPPPPFVTITKVEPALPLEHQPIEVSFVFHHFTPGAVISAIVRGAPGGSEFPITISGIGTASGSVQSFAPSAGKQVPLSLDIFLKQPSGDVSPTPDFQSVDERIDIAASYVFRIDNIECIRTRSAFTDKDFVRLALEPDDTIVFHDTINEFSHVDPADNLIADQRIGNVNPGVHPVGVAVGTFDIPPSETSMISVFYQVVNSGFGSESPLPEFLNRISAATAQVLSDVFRGTKWDEVDKLTQFINKETFANCDGVVAIDAFRIDGSQLIEKTNDNGTHRERREYPEPNIPPDKLNALYVAALGCGLSGSKYEVTWSVQRTSFRA
jgi:hypothetical protein